MKLIRGVLESLDSNLFSASKILTLDAIRVAGFRHICHICQKSATRMGSKVKILRALNRLESKLSNAPRISFISHFFASISSFEILLFSEISVFLTEN